MSITLLYVIDAIRAQNCSIYGYERQTTPEMKDIASDGYTYTGVSPATWTHTASASIISGTRPFRHSVLNKQYELPQSFTVLPEALPDSVKTVGIVSSGYASSNFGHARGYDEFYDMLSDEDHGKLVVSASDLNNRAREVISNHDQSDDLFLLVWAVEPHWPYLASGPWGDEDIGSPYDTFHDALEREGRQRMIDRYDDQILEIDTQIGNLISFLKKEGLYESASIFVTGDHGEGFGEGIDKKGAKLVKHRDIPYQELVDVPFVYKPSADAATPKRTDSELASLIDIYPTICTEFGVEIPETVQGKSLLEESRTQVISQSEGYNDDQFESLRRASWRYILISNSWSLLSCLKGETSGYYKNKQGIKDLIRTKFLLDEILLEIDGNVELKRDLSDVEREFAMQLREEIISTRKSDLTENATSASTSTISDETKNNLRTLGYLD